MILLIPLGLITLWYCLDIWVHNKKWKFNSINKMDSILLEILFPLSVSTKFLYFSSILILIVFILLASLTYKTILNYFLFLIYNIIEKNNKYMMNEEPKVIIKKIPIKYCPKTSSDFGYFYEDNLKKKSLRKIKGLKSIYDPGIFSKNGRKITSVKAFIVRGSTKNEIRNNLMDIFHLFFSI